MRNKDIKYPNELHIDTSSLFLHHDTASVSIYFAPSRDLFVVPDLAAVPDNQATRARPADVPPAGLIYKANEVIGCEIEDRRDLEFGVGTMVRKNDGETIRKRGADDKGEHRN